MFLANGAPKSAPSSLTNLTDRKIYSRAAPPLTPHNHPPPRNKRFHLNSSSTSSWVWFPRFSYQRLQGVKDLLVYLISAETNRIAGAWNSGGGRGVENARVNRGRMEAGKTKKKLHNRFGERRIESSNSFQRCLFACIHFSISIYNAVPRRDEISANGKWFFLGDEPSWLTWPFISMDRFVCLRRNSSFGWGESVETILIFFDKCWKHFLNILESKLP